jgi:hypothetical protein
MHRSMPTGAENRRSNQLLGRARAGYLAFAKCADISGEGIEKPGSLDDESIYDRKRYRLAGRRGIHDTGRRRSWRRHYHLRAPEHSGRLSRRRPFAGRFLLAPGRPDADLRPLRMHLGSTQHDSIPRTPRQNASSTGTGTRSTFPAWASPWRTGWNSSGSPRRPKKNWAQA